VVEVVRQMGEPLELAEQAVAVMEVMVEPWGMVLPIQVAEVVALEPPYLALAAQALSSFHTQAQPNYLVVELLPNQAVTSFTHSHLLAHLALCHL
jgi:hypothetical protein